MWLFELFSLSYLDDPPFFAKDLGQLKIRKIERE
jgi:hypothetical protein